LTVAAQKAIMMANIEGVVVMKKFLQDFKEFALKGNMLAMAVGILIGAAFQSLITSLTDDVISPLLGIFVNTNFDNLYMEVAGAYVAYGAFLTSAINFFIMALIIFMFVRFANKLTKRMKKEKEQAPEATCPHCLTTVNEKATRCPACTSRL